jgi:ABC-type multidrug transport system ATPase subunit/pSer/pThr/pTyr-binding forkhead associated (FHA) protein
MYLKTENTTIFLSNTEVIIIGRKGYGAVIEIDDSSVSRSHAAIKKENDKIFIKDLKSLNGTFINGKKIKHDEWIEITKTDQVKVVSERIKIIDKNEGFKLEPPPESELVIEPNSQKKSTQNNFKSFIAQNRVVYIGRMPSNHLILDDPTVSRKHAKISFKDGTYFIEDLGSTNKTHINGKELESKTKLKESDVVTISFYQINLLTGLTNLREQENAIKAIGIEKKYSNNKIGLRSMSLEIPHSTFAALMGPSGCGKSTLLKCLNGDNPATSGEVLIHGLSLTDNFNLIKKKIGYVPQDDIIHEELTVYKTLYYAAKLRLPDDTSDKEINSRINKVIQSLSLNQDKEKDIRKSKVLDLSGGQRKRVSIAVEMLTEPTILFLDEPTSPLDPETIDNFLTSLRKLSKEGTTIVMVTHKPEDLNYVDQVIFLGVQGHLTYKGPAHLMTTHFEVESIVQVYSKMSNQDTVAKYYQKPSEITFESKRIAEFQRDKPDSWFLQLYWLTMRYFSIKRNDKENLILLLAQPIIIACLLCLVFNEMSTGVLFLMAISGIWFGVSNAAKEIVGELSIYRRERMFNVNINTYILSKWLVLSLIAFIQTFIFVSIIYLNFKINTASGYPDTYLHGFLPTTLFMFYISFSATLLGLFLSAYFTTTEKVMTVVPIALMPQIMLAGVMNKIDNTIVEILSFSTLGRWGTEGFARMQDHYFPNQDNIQSVLYGIPTANGETKLVSGSALTRLDLYNNKLIDDGILIGNIFDSMQANLVIVMAINIIIYGMIYIALKRKDSI